MRAVTLYYHLPLYYYYYVSARRPRNRPYAYDTPRASRTRSRAQSGFYPTQPINEAASRRVAARPAPDTDVTHSRPPDP